MLIKSLVELHAWLHSYLYFSLLEKLFLSNLDTFSTLSWHLAICQALKLFLIVISTPSQQLGGSIEISFGSSIPSWQLGGSIEISFGSSIASRQLVDWSSFFLAFVELSLDRPSIAESVEAFLLDTWLDTCLNTSRHLYLSKFTNLLYKGLARFPSHFSRSLSR